MDFLAGTGTGGWPETAVTQLNEADRRLFIDALKTDVTENRGAARYHCPHSGRIEALARTRIL